VSTVAPIVEHRQAQHVRAKPQARDVAAPTLEDVERELEVDRYLHQQPLNSDGPGEGLNDSSLQRRSALRDPYQPIDAPRSCRTTGPDPSRSASAKLPFVAYGGRPQSSRPQEAAPQQPFEQVVEGPRGDEPCAIDESVFYTSRRWARE
jgi:hypothetical protein